MASKMTDTNYEIRALRRVDSHDEDTGESTEMVEIELRIPANERAQAGMSNATIRVPKDKVPGLYDRVSATFMREAEETA
jgi:hypothetical protein